VDTRQPGQSISTIQAHEGESGGLSLSSIDGLLTTVGGEVASYNLKFLISWFLVRKILAQ
jgi:hypothetical protein